MKVAQLACSDRTGMKEATRLICDTLCGRPPDRIFARFELCQIGGARLAARRPDGHPQPGYEP
jgi:hypothetical protein